VSIVKLAERLERQLAVHRLREGYKEGRCACINRIRRLLAEFGRVYPQSPQALKVALPEALEDAANALPDVALGLSRPRRRVAEAACRRGPA
jgi:transposase